MSTRNASADKACEDVVHRTWTRTGRNLTPFGTKPWQVLKAVNGDPLAFRWLMLRREGWGTLRNVINGDHGRPNVF